MPMPIELFQVSSVADLLQSAVIKRQIGGRYSQPMPVPLVNT